MSISTAAPITAASSIEATSSPLSTGISHPLTSTAGSIAPSTQQSSPRSTDKPTLTPPSNTSTLSIIPFLHCVERFETFGKSYLGTQSKWLGQVNGEIEALAKENIQKIKEAAAKAAASDVWSFLKKIATAILAAVSMVIGVSLIASGGGAIIGGAMIASGILSIANLILSESGFWDSVAKQLANNNEDKRKMLALILPAAVGIISGAVGIFGSIGSLAFSSLNFFQQAFTILHAAVGMVDGVTTMGKGVADGQVIRAEAELVKTRFEASLATFQSSQISTSIEKILAQLDAAQKQASNLLKMIVQSNLRVVQG